MTCFWTKFVDCFDPDCVSAVGVFAAPFGFGDAVTPYIPAVYSDASLSTPLSPTSATLLQVDIFDTAGMTCVSGCDPYAWVAGINGLCTDYSGLPWGDPLRMPDDPPLSGATNAFSDTPGLSFDPTVGFDPDTVTGYTAALAGASCPVVVYQIGSDVGTFTLICVDDCCH